MLEILQAPNHVAAFRFANDVTAQDYDRVRAEVESRLKLSPRIAVYAELAEPVHFNAGALWTDLRYAFAKRAEWKRFARVAIVSEKAWIKAMAHAFDPFLAEIESRTFASHERAAALTWASEFRPDVPRQSALRLIATTRPDTYAFVWNGKVTRSDVEHVLGVLKAELESHISVRVLGRIEHMGGIELPALLKSTLFRVKLLGVRKIERYAVVGGPSWLPYYVRAAAQLTSVNMRHFTNDREQDAWSWLEAQAVTPAESAAGQAQAVAAANANN